MKKRIVDFLNAYYHTTNGDIYVGGSQSKYNSKKPNYKSDIDIYVFRIDFGDGYKDNELSNLIKLGLGADISIYHWNIKYKNSVSVGMEKLN